MEEGCSTEDLVPKQAPAPLAVIPVAARFWAMGPSDEVAGRGLATSLRAKGKATAMQAGPASPAKTNKELVCQL